MAEKTYYLGIDVGSTASKCVIANASGEIAGKGLAGSGAGTVGPKTAVDAALADAGVTMDDIAASCATGYGRNLMEWADTQMSELSCHAKGAAQLFPGVRTVIDIGGQDAKVLSIGFSGDLENFVMNDKCAAGTGRFLDVMASIFGCKVSDLSGYDAQSSEVAPISSTCTVFAESEVISKLSEGVAIPNIVAGIHTSVVERTAGLARRLGVKAPVVMTGGVALNERLRDRLADKLGTDIQTNEDSQFIGAYGAALHAHEKARS
ncbi:MAG TPA: 2-hydroxyglutaryl-CoA dehydratase [Candidatus Aphodovivens excrementavium]|nr:2-hydroxyglutaryl-CoA dehydratase [Candidatus Aphodovivens excrementavium]